MTGWVYKIIEIKSQETVYIGSTFGKYFCLRGHKKPSAQSKHRNLYGYVEEKGGWTSFEIKIQSEHETEEQTRSEEVKLIQEIKPRCNIHHKKTETEKKEERNLWQKEYFEKNPDQKAKHREANKVRDAMRSQINIDCPCGGKYTLQNKTNHYNRNIHKKYEANKCNSESKNGKETTGNL